MNLINELLSLFSCCQYLFVLANLFVESVGLPIPATPIPGEAVPQEEVAPLLQFR